MNNHFNSEAIKALRRRLGLTQVDFAKFLDVDSITVSRWERGVRKPMPVHLRRLTRLEKKGGK